MDKMRKPLVWCRMAMAHFVQPHTRMGPGKPFTFSTIFVRAPSLIGKSVVSVHDADGFGSHVRDAGEVPVGFLHTGEACQGH